MDTVDSPMTYAVGDLHGEITLLRQLLSTLPFRAHDTLVFLGDYMDRGEDSIATVLALAELQRQHANCVFLRGNHDDVWLSTWDGARFQEAPEINGAVDVWNDCNGKIPFAVGYWLEQTRVDYEDAHAYYVHAGFLPRKVPQQTSDMYKMWGTPGFLGSKYNWGKPVVFGHWTMLAPLLEPNKIGIDTGAYKNGVLTAVRLPDRTIFQVHRKY